MWVAAPLHDAYAKKNVERKNSYKDDPDLPYEQVGKWDGYTRGHMLGSAERLVSREANSQVMYFSNIGPQLGQNDYFNGGGGQWNTAEDWVDEQWRGLADTCYQVVGCYWANTNKKVSGTTIPTHYFTVLLKAKKSAGKKWVVNCTRDEPAMHRPVYRAQVLLEERRDETRSIRLERHLHARLRSRSEDRTQILHERSQRSEGHLRHTRLELLIVSRHCPSTPATEFGPSKRQCRETRRPSKRGAVLV